MKLKPVMIKWKDAESHDEWIDKSEFTGELPIITSVGFLIKTTKESYIFAQNIDETNESISMTMTVPKAWCVGKPRLLK